MSHHKALIVGGVTMMMAAVGVTAVYLPNYTEKSFTHAANVPNSTNLMGGATNQLRDAGGGGSRGSMWGNIEKERKNAGEVKIAETIPIEATAIAVKSIDLKVAEVKAVDVKATGVKA